VRGKALANKKNVDDNFGPCGQLPFPSIDFPLKIDVDCHDSKKRKILKALARIGNKRHEDIGQCDPCKVTIDVPSGVIVGGPGPIGLKGGQDCSQCAIDHILTCPAPVPTIAPAPTSGPAPTPEVITCGDGCLAGSTVTSVPGANPGEITYTFDKGLGGCDVSHFVIDLPHCINVRDVQVTGCTGGHDFIDNKFGPCGSGSFPGLSSPLKIDLGDRSTCGGVLSVTVTIPGTTTISQTAPIGLKGGQSCNECVVHHTFQCESCHKDPPLEAECCPGFTNPLTNCVEEDKCHTVVCANGGECVDATGDCNCVDDWTGETCGIRNCGPNGYYIHKKDICFCKRGWAGEKCDTCDDAGNDKEYVCINWHSYDDDSRFLLIKVKNEHVQKHLDGGGFLPNTLHGGVEYDCGCNPVIPLAKRSVLNPQESMKFDDYIDECIQTSNLTMMEKETLNEFWDDCAEANGNNASSAWIWLTIIFLIIAVGMTIALICCLCTGRRSRKSVNSKIGSKASSRRQSNVIGGDYTKLKTPKAQN
jgi:hypothetical protein